MVTRALELIRLEFVGEGSYFKDANSVQKYIDALFRLTLCDMCEIDKYICVFQDYYYRTDSRKRETYLEMFFSKIPDPWGKKLREEYSPGTKDTLGKRIFHTLDKLSKWCEESTLFRKTRNLKYQLKLCCNNLNMPTQ